jgi:hypothetical protein
MHFGRAGQLAAMAEILARGWNVAIPEVDLGDDVFVAQDDGARLTRVQLKTTVSEPRDGGRWTTKTIALPLRQFLRENEPVPLTYAFAVRAAGRWQFVVVPRDELRALWDDFRQERSEAQAVGKSKGGRPPEDAAADPTVAGIQFTFTEADVTAWGGRSFQRFRNNWERFELLMQPAKAASTGRDPTPSPAPPPASGPEEGAGD